MKIRDTFKLLHFHSALFMCDFPKMAIKMNFPIFMEKEKSNKFHKPAKEKNQKKKCYNNWKIEIVVKRDPF